MLLRPPQNRGSGGDHHHVFLNIFNRMVAAVVTKFHFDGLRTARQRQQLMTETDAEYRNIGFEEFLDGCNGVIARGRVAVTVGEEDAVRIHFQHIFRRSLCRNDGQSTTSIHQHTQDVALGTKIISHDVERQLVFFFASGRPPVSVQLPCVQL